MVEYNWEINGPDGGRSKDDSQGEKIDCLKCRFYEVTWDPDFPRGCRMFGIKGKAIPSETVKANTGRECPAFAPRSR